MQTIIPKKFTALQTIFIIYVILLTSFLVSIITAIIVLNLSKKSILIPRIFSPYFIDWKALKEKPLNYHLSKKYQDYQDREVMPITWQYKYIINENIKGPLLFVKENKDDKETIENKKIVIHFPGILRATIRREADSINTIPIEWKDYHHVFINYPNDVQNIEEIIEIGQKTIQYYLEQGYKMENMILKGHSMGGAVSTEVAYKFKDKGEKFHSIYNIESFSKSNAVREKIIKYFIPKSIQKLWNIFPDETIFRNDLPTEKIHILCLKQDDVIKYNASMHKAYSDLLKKPAHIKVHLFDDKDMSHNTPGLVLERYFRIFPEINSDPKNKINIAQSHENQYFVNLLRGVA